MMISKTEESIIRGNCCYTKFQTLTTDSHHVAPEGFLNEIINSRYHFWQGDKFERGITWTFSDERGRNVEYKDVKTFGFYDNNNIRPSDYKLIDGESLERRLSSFILQETDDKDYENRIRTLIPSFKDQGFMSYQFLPDKLETSKFSVYSYFIAFILIDKELKKAIRIEFGQD